MSDRGSVTLALAILAAAAIFVGLAQTVHPSWVPGWMTGATIVLAFIGAAWRAWPAVRRAVDRMVAGVRVAWAGLRRLGEVIDTLLHLDERLARIEVDGGKRVAAVEQSIATMRVESKADLAEIHTAIVEHAATSEESFGRLTAQTAGALADHVATYHRTPGG